MKMWRTLLKRKGGFNWGEKESGSLRGVEGKRRVLSRDRVRKKSKLNERHLRRIICHSVTRFPEKEKRRVKEVVLVVKGHLSVSEFMWERDRERV